MPRRDGTGPMGAGAMTGRGFGLCAGGTAVRGLGFGCGRGRGFGWRAFDVRTDDVSRKDVLTARKAELEKMLTLVDQQIESL